MSRELLNEIDITDNSVVSELIKQLNERSDRRRFFSYFPNTGPLRRELYQKHLEFFRAGKKYRERCLMAANRIGKALRNNTLVATPTGWVQIGDLLVGAKVVAGDGSITRVTGVYPQGVVPLYRLRFDGRATIDCCGEHLWLYQPAKARYAGTPSYGEWVVANTATIIERVGARPKNSRARVLMPMCRAWDLPSRYTPLDPYLVGLLIGDGGLTDYVRFSSADPELITAIRNAVPPGVRFYKIPSGVYDWVIAAPGGRGHGQAGNPVRQALKSLGLMGHRSETKRVPKVYLENSTAVRLAILQGLMDTDGSIDRQGSVEFCTTSPGLAEDVAHLIHSLGGKQTTSSRRTHYTYKGEQRTGQVSYRIVVKIDLCLFRLKRKADRWRPRRVTSDRVLHSIEPAPPGAATCISVAHPTSTFVIEHGIVTHNTEGAGGYEMTAHLTGLYPPWWEGRVFTKPISAWAAGKYNETTRDILQMKLLGPLIAKAAGRQKGVAGTGMIPGELIGQPSWKAGLPDLVDSIPIRHTSGGFSHLGMKSYQQGPGSFEGTEKHVIWLDEEPPMDVYGECVIRTAGTTGGAGSDGIIMLTFTPLLGMSEVVLSFMPKEDRPTVLE